MMKIDRSVTRCRISLLVAAAVVAGACSDAGKQGDRAAQANTPAQPDQSAPALAAYRKAVADKPDDAQANQQLGSALLQFADLTEAYHYLLKAQALEPGNSDVALGLGTVYLIGSHPEFARERGTVLIGRDPTSVTGLILVGATAASRDEIAQAAQKLEADSARFGSDPLPRLALGSLYWRKGDTASAERSFQAAVASDQKSAGAHAVLSGFYGARGNSAGSAQELKTFNDLVAADPVGRVKAATAYLLLNRREDAKRILREGMTTNSGASPTARLLAEMALADADAGEAGTALAGFPAEISDVNDLVLRARYHLLKTETAAAMQDLQRAVGVAPNVAPVHYQLALADLQTVNSITAKPVIDTLLKSAVAQLGAALKLAPDYPEAVFQSAALKTQVGAPQDAIADLDRFSKANPSSIRARMISGTTLLASGRAAEASEAFQNVLRMAPNNAEAHYWLGTVLLRNGKATDARAEFEKAVDLSAGYPEPVIQLVLLDLSDRKVEVAFTRVNRQIERAPKSARLYNLLGMVDAARNDQSGAEAAYLKAISLDPNLADAHARLAELYRTSGKLDQAVANAEQAARLSPKSVEALMALGSSHQQQGDRDKAREAYARVLSLDPRNLGAANNLAFLMSEEQGNLDSALKLATTARAIAPNDPHVADTMGWILYRRKAYTEAAPILKYSAAQLPDSPIIQYHLGMAAQQLGDTALARRALSKALASGAEFDGKADAQRALAQLK